MTNNAPVIKYVKQTEGTPVLPFVIDAYTSLRRAGWIDGETAPASGGEEAFYITNARGRVVAVLSFFETPADDDAAPADFTVNMGFVLKAYRKRGYYRALWDRLVQEGRARHLKTITGYHAAGNAGILAFCASTGRKLKYVCSEFTL